MHQLGATRGIRRHHHLLQTPDTFVRAPLPGMQRATAIVHVNPAAGARFTQYTVEFDAGGKLEGVADQRFTYVLEGQVQAGKSALGPGDFAYLPAESGLGLVAAHPARVVVIEKAHQPLTGVAAPDFLAGSEARVPGEPLLGDPAVEVRTLLPNDPAFDFAVNTMTYQPGATLPAVEMHVMEHGLLMLEGEGVYRLGDRWYNVTAGDFIWMAPYCPQWFGALGKTPAKYLIYKDWNR